MVHLALHGRPYGKGVGVERDRGGKVHARSSAMKLGNAAFELAELRTAQERDAGISRARAAVNARGRTFCVDCDEPISSARRQAMPSADRCLACQTKKERQRGRRG
ncbi:TraR/DksA C4-type zinc finger protein [Nitratireductor sp. B36]|uniref:TraR/DksA C4-type zinc finger protein n=1 Tax=Nitratireductor sp. B36 TaxID=2762059 RepID=UPI00351DA437